MTRQDASRQLIEMLLEELPQYRDTPMPALPQKRWTLLRSLMNLRPPMPASGDFLRLQDDFLQQMTREKGVTDLSSLTPSRRNAQLFLWQGDITTLRCDAIVNAANSQLLGCFSPCHGCIDNMIHTMSGVQLRLACNEIMLRQGHEEPAGQAKITPAFNLPCRYVIHTVGPIVDGALTKAHEKLLASCYRKCLETADENSCQSIAFCCISTGVFMFPNQRAAEIAVETVENYLQESRSPIMVVFNVFKDSDRAIYEALLQ